MVVCPLLIATVSCESGASAKLVDTSVVVNVERARSSSERVCDSLLDDVGTGKELVTGVIPKVADCPSLLVVTQKSRTGQIP